MNKYMLTKKTYKHNPRHKYSISLSKPDIYILVKKYKYDDILYLMKNKPVKQIIKLQMLIRLYLSNLIQPSNPKPKLFDINPRYIYENIYNVKVKLLTIQEIYDNRFDIYDKFWIKKIK